MSALIDFAFGPGYEHLGQFTQPECFQLASSAAHGAVRDIRNVRRVNR